VGALSALHAEDTKAVIYLRQSLDRTGEEFAVDRQRTDALALAKVRGWSVVRIEIDNDTSAAGKRRRPGFEAVLAAIETREVSAVIAWDMTRLTRNRRDTVRVIEAGERAKAVLAFCRSADLDLSTPSGRMLADILASVARQEIEQKSDRQKRANMQAAEQGRRIGGRRPFGYEPDGVTVREDEAAVIRHAFDDVLSGASLAQIARNWNAAGFTTPQKTRNGEPSKWIATTARGVLVNPRYAGFRGFTSEPEHGRRKVEATYPAKWPALVSEETWRAVVGMLSDPDRYTARYKGAKSLLTGVALCGVCGATVHSGGANTRTRRIYRCSAGSNGHVSRSAAPVDEWVSEVVIARLSRPDAAELLRDGKRPDIDALRTESQVLRLRLDQIATEFADGVLTSGQLRTMTGRLKSKIAANESEMADAGRVNIFGPLVKAKDVRRVWQSLSTDNQRKVIDALMIIRIMAPGRGRRTFDPDTVIIEPRV
jgi:DNA invertase Pin-like site-specific DNA recombinase